MNLYRITYYIGTDAPENTETQQITERSEKDARKYFKSICKNGVITDVELVSENTYATKQQERDTLAKIREMVEELGPESYLKTAFKGAFEDAEQNIEDDAAYCQYDRAELAEEKVKTLEGRIKELEGGVEELIQKDEERKAALERLGAERDELKKHILPAWLYRDLWMFLTHESELSRERMAQSAEIMANFAETPQDIAFNNAVANYRAQKERAEHCEQMATALDELEPRKQKREVRHERQDAAHLPDVRAGLHRAARPLPKGQQDGHLPDVRHDGGPRRDPPAGEPRRADEASRTRHRQQVGH